MPSAPGGSVVSEQNVALVRQIYDAWDRNASARDFIAEDVEYVNPSYAVEPGTRVGRKSFAVVRDTYEDFKRRCRRSGSLHGFWNGQRGAARGRARLRLDAARRPGGPLPLVQLARRGARGRRNFKTRVRNHAQVALLGC